MRHLSDYAAFWRRRERAQVRAVLAAATGDVVNGQLRFEALRRRSSGLE